MGKFVLQAYKSYENHLKLRPKYGIIKGEGIIDKRYLALWEKSCA